MKNKILMASALVIGLAFALNAYAVGGNGVGTSNQVRNRGENATTTNVQEQERTQERAQDGKINAEQHRSVVATFVKNLLQVADREGGIGEQVRVIAQQQNQSASTTIKSMERVQTRSKFKTFLIGSDYKNLGTLRSEMVQTENRLEQLNRLLEDATSEADKTEIQKQIDVLKLEQTKIESFVKTQESKSSLFGWFVKLFNK